MRDPYEVLGISRNATDDEIKKAYRQASRRYHPDANLDDPKSAEEKFKEVQQAYQQIMRERSDGASQGAYGGGSYYGGYSGSSYGDSQGTYGDAQSAYGGFGGWDFGGFGSFYGNRGWFGLHAEWDEQDSTQMRAAANYINGQSYREALHVLSEAPEKNAKWYYFSAMANYGMGNQAAALQHINQAISMEPMNGQYQQLKQRIQGGRNAWYEQQSSSYGRPIFSGGNFCLELCALNLFCNCCCGGRFFMC
ncbi:MAG: DnaJ domain-containing protein [Eubacteriales bacterium]|nr:DnaJ domain-containing protein [Eubacteriales bacterium]